MSHLPYVLILLIIIYLIINILWKSKKEKYYLKQKMEH